jgi:hypothetical protein
MRGPQAKGLGIPLAPPGGHKRAAPVPAYSDVCYDCGMVTLFVRVSDVKAESA